MTTYRKALWTRRIIFLAIPLFFAAFILVALSQSKWALLAFLPAVAAPVFAMSFGKRWSACPKCGEQILEKSLVGGGLGGGGVTLDAPSKACGYCGLDLTVPYDPE